MNQDAGAAVLAGHVRAGSMTAAKLVADALAAVDALDPVLHFMSESWAATALAAAGRIDALPPPSAARWQASRSWRRRERRCEHP